MGNPYLDETELTPETLPTPKRLMLEVAGWQVLVIALALAGLFLPPTGGWESLPIPTPIPIIDTKPDPAKTEGSWVVVIEQTEQRTPEHAKLMRDMAYWQSLEARGLKWRHYDYDADDAAAYRSLADSVGMPAVAIVGGKGELLSKVLAKFPCPAKEALDAKIKEVTGR